MGLYGPQENLPDFTYLPGPRPASLPFPSSVLGPPTALAPYHVEVAHDFSELLIRIDFNKTKDYVCFECNYISMPATWGESLKLFLV